MKRSNHASHAPGRAADRALAPTSYRAFSLALTGLVLVTSACRPHRDRHHHDPDPIPVYREVEPNDAVFDANYFGVLRPGDRFFIDGFSTDSGADPFDGFAFVSGEPIHVDFRLFQASPTSDFDVCLYDPEFDETIACFATDEDPESGGVDVTDAGIEFHLVVESFVGSGGYSLEIEVFPLYFAREASELSTEDGGALRSTSSTDGRTTRAASEYRARKPESARSVIRIEEDPASGERIEVRELLER